MITGVTLTLGRAIGRCLVLTTPLSLGVALTQLVACATYGTLNSAPACPVGCS